MIQAISTILISTVISIGAFFGIQSTKPVIAPVVDKAQIQEILIELGDDVLGGDQSKFFGGFPYSLSGSGLTSSATSINLTSLTIPQTGQEIVDGDLSTTFYVTVEPGNKNKQEFISCTTVAQGAGTNATLSGCSRGLSPIAPYTASSTLQFTHGGGTKLIFSNPPQLYDDAAFKNNDESITGTWTFDADKLPVTDADVSATTSKQFTTKFYVDNVANQGAATSSESVAGIIEQATSLETASSTPFDANNPHAINSENATSSPSRGCDGTATAGALCVVVAKLDGKVHQDFTDLSEAYTWTGLHNFNSPVITNSTTTINDIGGNFDTKIEGDTDTDLFYVNAGTDKVGIGTSTPDAKFSVDGEIYSGTTGYRFPDATVQATAALTTFGSFIQATTTDQQHDGASGEETYGNGDFATLTGGRMGTNGAIKVEAYITGGTFTSAGASFNLKLSGATVCSVSTQGITTITSGVGVVEFILFSKDSASSQGCLSSYRISDELNLDVGVSDDTSSVNTASDTVISLTINDVSGGSGDVFTVTGMVAYDLGRR